ncbi:MAG: ABC transporter substrate-binding protein [Bdellovibrionales bacterium]|nr:ABC transporter substrate-binding protein [Bdellovibrionales bacterium]
MARNLTLTLVVAAILLLGSLSLTRNRSASPQEIKIDALLCLSGDCAEWGESALRGIQLAVEEQNDSGGLLGRRIALTVSDTKEATSGAAAVTAYRHLRAATQAKLIIGPSWTPAGLSLAPIAAREDVLLISPSLGVADFNETAENLFNTWPHDEVGTRALASWAFAQGIRQAAILASDQPWEALQGRFFEEAFTEVGGTIMSHQRSPADSRDPRTEILRIMATRPEAVFLSSLGQMDVAARELRSNGYRGLLIAPLVDETRLLAADGALEGAVTVRYAEALPEFRERFRKRYGEEPGVAAATAFDAARSYFHAIMMTNSTEPRVLKTAYPQLAFEGASGLVRFDAAGAVQRTPQIVRVVGSSVQQMEEVQ